MTPEQKYLVQTSFEKVKPIANTAAALFYSRLFDLDPKLERLFKGDLEDQGRKLMHLIGLAVTGLNRPDELMPLLHTLGQRHAGYGVAEQDYETVGTALLWTLEHGLGDAFTPAVSEAWRAVYELLAGAMKAGAREALAVAETGNEFTTCTGGDRKGWRGYFPAAANKTSKKRETEMETETTYEILTGRFMTTLATFALTMFLFAANAHAATFTVTTTIDNGNNANPTAGSLRKAIIDSNATIESNTIKFNIPGAGVKTIAPPAPLPDITWAVTIDGYTQRPCASNPQPCSSSNTQANGSNASLLIEINGMNAGPNADGFTIKAADCVITGLVINRFSGSGISIEYIPNSFVYKGKQAHITGCFIGTNTDGNAAAPNADGIYLSQSPGNVIGGVFKSTRNLISGNTSRGIALNDFGASASGNLIAGNLIGTDKSGTGALGNSLGIRLDHVGGTNTIGGTLPVARNVISGNAGDGINFSDSDLSTIVGNYIGTDATGTAKVPNTAGIVFQGSCAFNQIGKAGFGNLISGNKQQGIVFRVGSPFHNTIAANLIGTKADGVSALGNGSSGFGGIELLGSPTENMFGGTAAGAGNVIAFNGRGVFIGAGTSNTLEQNLIYSNNGLGIDLNGANHLNDANDPDTGANNLQNYPVINSAINSSGITAITGSLNSEANKAYRIEFYANSQCNAAGNGDGQTYLGSTDVVTSGNNVNFSKSFPGFNLNQFVTATATDPDGNTSEFSQCKLVTAPPLPPGTLTLSASTYTAGEGVGAATVTVTRTGGSGGAVSVHYDTSNGSATAGGDYTATSGTLSWADGDAANKTFTIAISNDALDEADETVNVALSNPTGGATLGNPNTATLTITDNDPPLPVFISGVSQAEGNSGPTSFVFNVTLAGPSGKTVTVDYATLPGGSATAGSDYQTVSGTLTFAPGEVSKTVTVLVNGDTQEEPDEIFSVELGALQNATSGQSSATGTIINDDVAPPPTPTPTPTATPTPAPTPTVSISNVSLLEGTAGATSFDFNVTLSAPSSETVTVDYTTADGTAIQGTGDYQFASGTLTFNPGETTKPISVLVDGDKADEPDETFVVNLSNPTNAAIAQAQGTGIILNDDSASISIDDVSHVEGNSGVISYVFNVTLSAAAVKTVTVDYAAIDDSANSGSDYQPSSGTLTFNPGETSKQVAVLVNGDTANEDNEKFFVSLSNPSNATIDKEKGSGVISNDDYASASIDDVSQAEGNNGTTSFTFTVALSSASFLPVTVDYVTVDDTAQSGSDYQPASGTLSFAPGETSKTITVMVNGDTQNEPMETFRVNLTNADNASIAEAQGTGRILNDDAPAGPTFDFSQANYGVAEQLGAVTVTVVRNGDSSAAASVDYATADGSAVQKSDFEITAGTLNFAPGEASKTIQVLINQDSYTEGPESFSLVLSNPSGAALGQSSTQVNITDDVPESLTNPIDDPQSFVYMHYHDFLNREPDQAGLQFWTNQIASCGSDAQCIDVKRVNVSAAYFLSIEFQQTGYLLYLFQKESFAALPKYTAFMRDLQEVGRDVVVNSPGWEQKLAANQQQFAEKWVNRPEFKTVYDGMSNVAFVNTLYANAGVAPPQAERDALVTALDTATQTRAAALLEVAANAVYKQQEQNSAFVLMQYFGYLRRDPDSGPDSDLSGYYFWLNKLNQFNGDYQQAEMVKAFLVSSEYRSRFGLQ